MESEGWKAFLGIFAGAFAVVGLIILAFFVFVLVCNWKFYEKAGRKGWEAIVPFYSNYVLIKEIAGLNWWYFLIGISGTIFPLLGLAVLEPLAGLLSLGVNFFTFYNLAAKFHKDTVGFALLGTFLPGILIPIIALSKNYQFDGSVTVSPNGPINSNK